MVNGLNPQPGTLTHALMQQSQQQTNPAGIQTISANDDDETTANPYAPEDVYENSGASEGASGTGAGENVQEAPPEAPAAVPPNTPTAGREHIAGGGRQFGGNGMDAAALREILAEGERATDSFRQLVEGMFNRQSNAASAANGQPGIPFGEGSNFSFTSATNLESFLLSGGAVQNVDSQTQQEAQALLEGPFSVEATAGRIMSFAVAISRGDDANIDWIQRAVEAGFGGAQAAWGSDMPSITQQTREAVMNAFDEWREGGVDAITLLSER